MKHSHTRCAHAVRAALVEVRETAGLSQRALSAKLKRGINHCYYIESGLTSISICEVLEWIELCGGDAEEILRKIRKKS